MAKRVTKKTTHHFAKNDPPEGVTKIMRFACPQCKAQRLVHTLTSKGRINGETLLILECGHRVISKVSQ